MMISVMLEAVDVVRSIYVAKSMENPTVLGYSALVSTNDGDIGRVLRWPIKFETRIQAGLWPRKSRLLCYKVIADSSIPSKPVVSNPFACIWVHPRVHQWRAIGLLKWAKSQLREDPISLYASVIRAGFTPGGRKTMVYATNNVFAAEPAFCKVDDQFCMRCTIENAAPTMAESGSMLLSISIWWH